jgi:hypothetical protein
MTNKDLIVWPIGKFKNLPADMRVAFEKIPGAMPTVKFENGKFFKVIWVSLNPVHWPEEVKIHLAEDDALVLTSDYGVEGRLLGALFAEKKGGAA